MNLRNDFGVRISTTPKNMYWNIINDSCQISSRIQTWFYDNFVHVSSSIMSTFKTTWLKLELLAPNNNGFSKTFSSVKSLQECLQKSNPPVMRLLKALSLISMWLSSWDWDQWNQAVHYIFMALMFCTYINEIRVEICMPGEISRAKWLFHPV